MDALLLIGRILFVPAFILSGAGFHLGQMKAGVGYAQSKGVPLANLVVPLSGIQIILGGALVVLGVWPDLGALLLVAFAIPTAIVMHNFWTVEDPMQRVTEMSQFQKDLALGGAALVMFAFWAYGGAVGPALGEPLFSLTP
jgi:uncharacterized membrane protein YphA (DoxX/SURF4 family)